MKPFVSLLVFILLSVGVAACATREKPPLPTPTLSQFGLPAGATETPVAMPSSVGTLRATPQGTLPTNFFATAGPPLSTPTKGSSLEPTSTIAPTSAPSPASTPVPLTSSACPDPYTVSRGEWANQIARKCGVTFEALQAANPTANLAVVYPGQRLNIPEGTSGPTGKTTYVVRVGDTLAAIATRFGTTTYALQIANNLTNPNNIYVGQTLTIP